MANQASLGTETATDTRSSNWDIVHRSWSDHQWDIVHRSWSLQDPQQHKQIHEDEKPSQVRQDITGIINELLDELPTRLESSGIDGRHVSFGVWTKTGTETENDTSGASQEEEINTTQFNVLPISHRRQLKDAMKVYRPLERESQFRLFKLEPGGFAKNAENSHSICGQMHIADLKDPPSFVALSYTWESVLDTGLVKVDGYSINVTQGLIEALLRMRHPTESQLIWVDQLAINQFDSAEKAHQVSQMGNIFESASQVLIWLGEETEDTAVGMEIIQFLADGRGFERQTPWDSQTPHLINRGLSDIMTRRWWKRVWVVQEAALSCNYTTIVCGSHTLTWPTDPETIRAFVRGTKFAVVSPQWREEGLAKDLEKGLAGANMQSLVDLLNRQLVQIRRRQELDIERFEPDLLDIAFDVRDMESTDPRDKLYAILQLDSIRGSGNIIVPDYAKPVESVYEDLRKALLASVEPHSSKK